MGMGDGFIQVKRLNQQYQSTEGKSYKGKRLCHYKNPLLTKNISCGRLQSRNSTGYQQNEHDNVTFSVRFF